MTRCDQVIVEVALFYRLDGRLFFAKGREQRASGVGMILARLREEFGSVHIRQTLARQDERHWLAFVSQLPQSLKGITTRSSLDGPVPFPVATIKVARNNLPPVPVIIYYKYDWLTHDRHLPLPTASARSVDFVENVKSPSFQSTITLSLSLISPANKRRPIGVSSSFSIARFSGR